MASRLLNFQCSICKLTTQKLVDNRHITIDTCSLTLGCRGRLLITSDDVSNQVGEVILNKSTALKEDPNFFIGNAANATITFAFRMSEGAHEDVANEIFANFQYRRVVVDKKLKRHVYTVISPTSTISGPDNFGITPIFGQVAIDNLLVTVTLNGVSPTVTLSPNTVTFPTPLTQGDTVVIEVASEQSVFDIPMRLRSHDSLVDIHADAWSNVRTIKTQTGETYYLYSTDRSQFSTLPNGSKIALMSIDAPPISNMVDRGILLLSTAPYEKTDRYMNFDIPLSSLLNNFALVTSVTGSKRSLSVPKSVIREIYPPRFIGSLSAPEVASTKVTDSADLSMLKSRKILS